MQTLVQNKSDLSVMIFEDEQMVIVKADCVEIGDSESEEDFRLHGETILDLNGFTHTLHKGVTPPEDWQQGKYFYVGYEWIENPDWIEPDPIPED